MPAIQSHSYSDQTKVQTEKMFIHSGFVPSSQLCKGNINRPLIVLVRYAQSIMFHLAVFVHSAVIKLFTG